MDEETPIAAFDGDEIVALQKTITERLAGMPASSAYAVGTAMVVAGFKQITGRAPSPHEFAALVDRFNELLAVRGVTVQ